MTRPTTSDIPRLLREDPPVSRYLNYTQAAAYLAMPVGTLRSLVSHRKIPHARMGPRLVRFELADLDAWIAAHKQCAVVP